MFEKLRARPKIDFSKCRVYANPVHTVGTKPDHVPRNLVQLHADETEVQRRVECFIERKREEINQNNVQDYIEPVAAGQADNDADETCARIRSSVYRSKNASSHLKVHRVKNEYGPQTRRTYTDALDKLMQPVTDRLIKSEPGLEQVNGNDAINERLDGLEQSVRLTPVSGNVYERLKAIESRLFYLETVSPEYKHFLQPKTPNAPVQSGNVKRAKKTHSVNDIDLYIRQLQQKTSVV